MGSEPARLRDVVHGRERSRLRLLAPLRYLAIFHPEKRKYDVAIPLLVSLLAWALYTFVVPTVPVFGADGILKSVKDFLALAVPFSIGALASVAMGGPGAHMDRRPAGADLVLYDRALTLRQFVCYLLGYLSFLCFITLVSATIADLIRVSVITWFVSDPRWLYTVHSIGVLVLATMLSTLFVTVLWSLYFLTDIVNRID